jgi:hypothetical protein
MGGVGGGWREREKERERGEENVCVFTLGERTKVRDTIFTVYILVPLNFKFCTYIFCSKNKLL